MCMTKIYISRAYVQHQNFIFNDYPSIWELHSFIQRLKRVPDHVVNPGYHADSKEEEDGHLLH